MKDILDKISSYNLFNYLLPGVLFVLLAKHFTSYDLIIDNDFIGAFLYYFIGMVISRIGSLIVEPLFKYFSIVKYSEYEDFIIASKKDPKIELFSEVNNMYRTLIAVFVILLFLKAYNGLVIAFNISDMLSNYSIIVLLIILFIMSFRKQTKYVYQRVEANKS